MSPKRARIARISKAPIEKAIEELRPGYNVSLQGKFDKTPIVIQVEVTTKKGEIP